MHPPSSKPSLVILPKCSEEATNNGRAVVLVASDGTVELKALEEYPRRVDDCVMFPCVYSQPLGTRARRSTFRCIAA
jgi:hypothetical protein